MIRLLYQFSSYGFGIINSKSHRTFQKGKVTWENYTSPENLIYHKGYPSYINSIGRIEVFYE